jgi:hypothetical protein
MNRQAPTRVVRYNVTSRVAEFNNLGVQYFEAQNYQAAVDLFRNALEWITSPLRESDEICLPRSPAIHTSTRVVTNLFTPILKAKVPSDDCTNDSQPFLRFSQALEVTDFKEAYSENQMVNEVILSAIIIWNMGLVYHCTSRGIDDRLRRANALYLKSWSLVESFVSNGSCGNLMVDFFTQALLNNLGSCCQERDHVHDARMWSDHLICYAQSITASFPEEATDAASVRLQEQTNNFVLNAIMRLQCRPSFLAPAA